MIKNIKKYWCDPDEGKCSAYIEESKPVEGSEDLLSVKLEGKEDFIEVKTEEIIDVLVSLHEVGLEELINQPQYDIDYYLHHLGGVEYKYKGYILAVFGEHSTFLKGERIYGHPELLLEFKDDLEFGDNCWIEIVEEEDFDSEYAVCDSMREAKESVDKYLSEGVDNEDID